MGQTLGQLPMQPPQYQNHYPLPNFGQPVVPQRIPGSRPPEQAVSRPGNGTVPGGLFGGLEGIPGLRPGFNIFGRPTGQTSDPIYQSNPAMGTTGWPAPGQIGGSAIGTPESIRRQTDAELRNAQGTGSTWNSADRAAQNAAPMSPASQAILSAQAAQDALAGRNGTGKAQRHSGTVVGRSLKGLPIYARR
jgi:hypothetical protein